MHIDDKNLSSFITEKMKALNIAGVAIAVVDNNDIIYQQAFGVHRTPQRPALTVTTSIQGASLSKSILAFLAMKMVEAGQLDLDIPLFDYRKDEAIQGKYVDQITARHVLTHTTGFPNWREDAVLQVDAPIGKRYSYSGEGFELLQHTIEAISDTPLHLLAKQQIFDPLGMEHSSFAWGLDSDGRFVMDEEDNPVSVDDKRVVKLMSSAAFSLLTCAKDYAKFMSAMLNPKPNYPTRLNPSISDMMLDSIIQVGHHAAISWGLGWGLQQVGGEKAFWHWGGAQNRYANYAIGFPNSKQAVIIMTNSSRGFEVHEQIAQIALNNNHHHPAFDW